MITLYLGLSFLVSMPKMRASLLFERAIFLRLEKIGSGLHRLGATDTPRPCATMQPNVSIESIIIVSLTTILFFVSH